jgi:hypothetical protein
MTPSVANLSGPDQSMYVRDVEDIMPQWDDPSSQAELAAQLQQDFGPVSSTNTNIYDDDEFDEDGDGDMYEDMDFEGHFDSEEEEELRRTISGYGLGRWMDGLVDVMLRLEGDFEEPFNQQGGNVRKQEEGVVGDGDDFDVEAVALPREADALEAQADVGFVGDVEPPPETPKSVWDDAAWFARLLARSVRS